MIVIPALDLRDGASVQLVGGSYSEERIRLSDPTAVAASWASFGFSMLHVVDLDAATGAGTNGAIVESIIRQTPVRVNVGGGIRTSDRIAELLDIGAHWIVVGTRALEDRRWIESEAARFPGRLVVATDIRRGRLAVRGWRESIALDVFETVQALGTLPLAALLVTAIDVEGTLNGPDLELIEQIVAVSAVPVIASGGIGSASDLQAVASKGAFASVVGMALYSGAIDPRELVDGIRGSDPTTTMVRIS